MVSNSRRIADYIMFGRSMKILMLSVGLLVFIAWWKIFGDQGKLVQESTVGGMVSERRDSNYLINLDNGRTVRVPGRGLLKVGARVRLLHRTYERGEPEILLSLEEEAGGGDS